MNMLNATLNLDTNVSFLMQKSGFSVLQLSYCALNIYTQTMHQLIIFVIAINNLTLLTHKFPKVKIQRNG